MRPSSIFSSVVLLGSVHARERITWDSSGTQIVGYHYAPACLEEKAPAVVLAHGLGGFQDGKLQPFAERFAATGYHAITFDYRHWGESDGEPRNLAVIELQQDDYRAAVRAVKTLPGVDPHRIVIWGTSLSGGHVLYLGAQFYNDSSSGVVGVISQVPMVNGAAAAPFTPPDSVPAIVRLAVADQATINTTSPPVYIPTCNHTGQLGLLTQPGAFERCVEIEPNPPPPVYGNISARIALQIPFYSPDATAATSYLPTYIGIGMDDNLESANATVNLAAKMPNATTNKIYGAGHFDVYPDEPFYEDNVNAQVAFLEEFVPLQLG